MKKMINKTEIEVRYQETDQMGIVYHANYLVWFEIGRTKFIESLGLKYAALEAKGYLSPVLDLQIKYKKPAKYGEKVIVETWLEKYNGIKTVYGYCIKNDVGEKLVTGYSTHTMVEKESFRLVRLKNISRDWHDMYEKQIKSL